MKKKVNSFLFVALAIFTFCWIGCSSNENTKIKEDSEIVILYENDVHCAIDEYVKFSGLKNELAKKHPNIAAVSVGDFIQGAQVWSPMPGTRESRGWLPAGACKPVLGRTE